MKILILTNYDMGLYKFRMELLQRLIADGHKVIIALPNGEWINELVELGCEYVEIELERHGMNPLKELKVLCSYRKILKNYCPDIIFSYTIKPNIYGSIAAQMQKIPCVANVTGLGTAVENSGLSQLLTVFLYKIAFRKIQRVFFQNTENREFFEKRHIAVDNAALLPGSGVNLEEFTVLEYPSDEHTEFAFISRIMKEKGIDHYLDMAEYIKGKYPSTVFHVCGFCEQAYEERLKNLHERGIIVYHGMVRDIKEVLKRIHCTIHPTYYPEGISNVLLESSACGRPIITTDRAGCREVVENGKNGYIVMQRDSNDLIEKVEKFLELTWEEKRQMGIYGRKKVEREFDRNIVVQAYVEELNNCDTK